MKKNDDRRSRTKEESIMMSEEREQGRAKTQVKEHTLTHAGAGARGCEQASEGE